MYDRPATHGRVPLRVPSLTLARICGNQTVINLGSEWKWKLSIKPKLSESSYQSVRGQVFLTLSFITIRFFLLNRMATKSHFRDVEAIKIYRKLCAANRDGRPMQLRVIWRSYRFLNVIFCVRRSHSVTVHIRIISCETHQNPHTAQTADTRSTFHYRLRCGKTNDSRMDF